MPTHDRRPRGWTGTALTLLALLLLPACQSTPVRESQLAPTLRMRSVDGGTVAFQSGIAVPSFSRQPRDRVDLDDGWVVQRAHLDEGLTFTPRERSLHAIEREAAGRTGERFDDHAWQRSAIPGGTDLPPHDPPSGLWYRLHFPAPAAWGGEVVTLKFGAVNYLADVWLNGRWLGYHEGGSTPFAFDATEPLRRGGMNVLVVRVLDPPWGSRLDVIPWGLTDFWNYAGIVGPVWLEATASPSVVRADVTPYLDAAEVDVVVEDRTGADVPDASVHVAVLPTVVTDANRTDPDPLHLVPAGRTPIVTTSVDSVHLAAGGTRVLSTFFQFASPDLWSLSRPALYVVEVTVEVGGRRVDRLVETFGLRRIQVDPQRPRLTLNGNPVVLNGASIHNERVTPARPDGAPRGGGWQTAAGMRDMLGLASRARVNLIRADHSPADPPLLMLADRSGFAVWEEIPLYHETPRTFSIAVDRGIAVQMLREMDLRDQDHPSVLFHGFANEGLGVPEREQALGALSAAERQIDGTRLTGQAMYGSNPADPTSRSLDVAGYTFYYGVFYGRDATRGTERALRIAHATYPDKPIMVLEFGRWSDGAEDEPAQAQLFRDTWGAIAPHLTSLVDGYVAAAVWWTLQDYWSDQPRIPIEHFGMFRADGSPRQVAAVAAASYLGPAPAATGSLVASGGRGQVPQGPDLASLAVRLGYALGLALVLLTVLVLALAVRRRRALDP